MFGIVLSCILSVLNWKEARRQPLWLLQSLQQEHLQPVAPHRVRDAISVSGGMSRGRGELPRFCQVHAADLEGSCNGCCWCSAATQNTQSP
jgi:hypothetical protein